MRTHIAFLITVFSFLNPGFCFANDSVQITDTHHCARLSDGKTHVVTLDSEGTPTLVKKGKAIKQVNTQINVNNQRIKLFKELEEDLKEKNDPLGTLGKRINKALGIAGKPPRDYDKVEDVLNDFGIIRAGYEQRALTLQTYKANVQNCEKNKFPSLETFFVQVSSYYARGTLESKVGFLLRIPQVNRKETIETVCLLKKNYNTSIPELRGKVNSSQVTFGSGPFCMGNSLMPADKNGCTGQNVESKGQMTAFFGTHVINTGSELGPDPSSELILGLLAQDASLDWNFKVLPLSSAPDGVCSNLSEK